MAVIDREQLLAVIAEARRAPSACNEQPARWRLQGDVVELLEDPSRRMPACDPSGRALRLALGAAWEGTRIALSARGLRFDREVLAAVPDEHGVVARGRVVDGGMRDLLSDVVMHRATWRGPLSPVPSHVLGDLAADLEPLGAVLIQNPEILAEAARVIDDATVVQALRPSAIEELTSWLRLSLDHPGWSRDGLNADALLLSPWAAWLRRRLLRRGVLSRLQAAGQGHRVFGDAARVLTASGMVALLARTDEMEVLTGARLYRSWLTVQSAGLCACPMGALTEDPALVTSFSKALGLPSGWRLVHLWRVGLAPGPVPLAARLPAEELLL